MPNWKKVIVSGSDAYLNSLNVSGDITASSAQLTASYSEFAITASYALNAGGGGGSGDGNGIYDGSGVLQTNITTSASMQGSFKFYADPVINYPSDGDSMLFRVSTQASGSVSVFDQAENNYPGFYNNAADYVRSDRITISSAASNYFVGDEHNYMYIQPTVTNVIVELPPISNGPRQLHIINIGSPSIQVVTNSGTGDRFLNGATAFTESLTTNSYITLHCNSSISRWVIWSSG